MGSVGGRSRGSAPGLVREGGRGAGRSWRRGQSVKGGPLQGGFRGCMSGAEVLWEVGTGGDLQRSEDLEP